MPLFSGVLLRSVDFYSSRAYIEGVERKRHTEVYHDNQASES
jgi:hypothetical protein